MMLSRSFAVRPLLRQQRLMSSVITLSDGEAVEKFSRVNAKSLLYFTATWCPPCKQIKPIYEQYAADFPDVAFGKVDVDDNPDAAMEYEISAVPTFIALEGEESVARFSGADPNQLKSMIEGLQNK